MSARQPPLNLRLTRLPDRPTAEFVRHAAGPGDDGAAAWSAPAGHVECGPDGHARLLHFAPRRWLVVGRDAAIDERLRVAEQAGVGVRSDVEGKWEAMVLAGDDAARALAGSIDIAGVLAGRGCAAVTLFDCPAIVQRAGGEFRLWVTASCAQSFADAIDRLAR